MTRVSGAELQVVDVVHTVDGSVLTVAMGSEQRELALGGLGAVAVSRALSLLRDRLDAEADFSEAATQIDINDVVGHTQRVRGVNGALVLDDTKAVTPDDVRASLRVLADLGRSGLTTVAVIGGLHIEERDRLDEHDALGRIIVRLDISQLVVIGNGARHLYMAASLEGSWDGESVLFDDVVSAYDFVRATTGPNTVILVSGGADGVDLAPLVMHLREVSA